MIEKFKTLFFVKSSLISLYLALTIPIPFISIGQLKIVSTISFVLGLFLIINITSDYVETCNNKISYNTNFISKILGRKNWEISWKDIKLIKSLPTSQGSKVYYLNTNKGDNFLIPQRVENFKRLLQLFLLKNWGCTCTLCTPPSYGPEEQNKPPPYLINTIEMRSLWKVIKYPNCAATLLDRVWVN